MKFFAVAVVLAIIGASSADRSICPHPNEAGTEVASERIFLDPPQAGHAALEMDLSSRVLGREVSCFTLISENPNTGPHIVSVGKNVRGGFGLKVFTEEKQGLRLFVQAYTPVTPTTKRPTVQD